MASKLYQIFFHVRITNSAENNMQNKNSYELHG